MATITIPISFIFNGNIQGNPGDAGNPLRVTPTTDPFSAFSAAPDATVQISFNDSDITTTDADADGVIEDTVGNNVRIQQILVDLDGDGIYESEITGQNPNDLDVSVNSQTGSNVLRLNGNLRLSQNGGSPQQFTQGNLFISNNEPGFDADGNAQIVEILNNGNNFVIEDSNDVLFPICLVAGTLIVTENGQSRIGDVKPGQMVLTLDHGFQPVRWVFKRTILPNALHKHAHLRPITIPAGSFGENLPSQDVQMSAQHRILHRGPSVELNFCETEVLAAAQTHPASRTHVPRHAITYVHLLFDKHEIINSYGLWTESFHPGDVGFGTIDAETRRKLKAKAPKAARQLDKRKTARMCLTNAQAHSMHAAFLPLPQKEAYV